MNVASGEKLHTMQGSGLSLAFSHSGAWLVSGGDYDEAGWHIQLWDTASGELRQRLLFQRGQMVGGELSFAFSPDDSLLVGGSSGQIALCNTASGEPLRTIWAHSFPVDTVFVAFTPDGSQLVSAANDGVIRRWGIYK